MNRKLHNLFISPKTNYLIFLSAIIIWCLLILLAPLFAKFEHHISSGLLYLFFSKICHQIPERSFFVFGKQLAVCSRCTGLYLGFIFGAIIYPFIFRFHQIKKLSSKYLFLACVPIGIDIFIRTFHIAENTFASRLITGLILGATALLFVLSGILAAKPDNHRLLRLKARW